jgi:hypothetical protein
MGTNLDVIEELVDVGTIEMEGDEIKFTLASTSSEPILDWLAGLTWLPGSTYVHPFLASPRYGRWTDKILTTKIGYPLLV